MKKNIIQIIKFGIVGSINTCSSWVIYYPLIFVNCNYLLATSLAYIISSIIGFILNKTWVFKSKNKTYTSVIKYYVVYGMAYVINVSGMYLIVEVIGLSEKIAPILCLCITIPFNYIFSRLWVFKERKAKQLSSKIHTFVICAYKESDYLEDCIKSLKKQTIKANVILTTSTPNKFIEKLVKKYDLKYYIRNEKSDIQDDWNFAVSKCKTELVTIAHQDDIYDQKYLENILSNYTGKELMIFTENYFYKNNKIDKNKNYYIKKLLKFPLRFKLFRRSKFLRIRTLSLGNTINCPSVTYNKNKLKMPIFTSNLKFGLDWDTFLKIFKQKGDISYISKPLIYYRLHDGATTKEFILDKKRYIEDKIMFDKMWPKWITKIIMHFYVKSYSIYS